MVLESRLAELLQGQAKKFISGFNAEHLNLGLLSGFLELRNLALNPEPFDELFLGSDLPFVVKGGTLSSAMLQLSLMQGELEILVDGLTLVMAPACKWLTREEVYLHRSNEMERLEFVHMRSQSQRRSLEREMFRKLFSDYLSRIKITVKNVHLRLEVDELTCSSSTSPGGLPLAVGWVINSCDVSPVPGSSDGSKNNESELLLAEQVQLKGLLLYQEVGSKPLVPWTLYQSTRACELGIFQKISQEEFLQSMDRIRQAHLSVPSSQMLLPSTDVSINVDLKSQSLFTDCHVENCLTLEVVICLQNPSRLRVTAGIVEGMRWLVRRALDFQMWPFLHALHGKPANGKGRWHILRSFIHLKRRIQGNAYNLNDAIRMRMNCKEYIRLYKKKFNGPQSSFHWRRSLPPLTAEDATRLGLIELSYPADKLVNFRMMAQTEMKTETSINSFSEEGFLGEMKRSPRSQVWQVRELTPMEQLHLHGQHGFGTNIFRGLPPPPSNLKVRIDIVAPLGLWWVCKLGHAAETGSWAVALDSGTQPVRLLLVDSISDNSVFATLEVPRGPSVQSVSLLLARTEAAFQKGAPPASEVRGVRGGGSGAEEWCSMIEFDGDICCWGQVKTVPMTASHSPWDLFGSFTCGSASSKSREERSFGRVTPLDELIAERFPRMRRPTSEKGAAASSPSLRMNLPLRMPGGQEGPFVALLRWCLSTPVSQSSPQSILACLAALVRSGYALAALRLHVSLPPVFLQGVESARVFSDVPLRLPPFDAACHFENGGLVDGFVVGLHNLYNFANLVAAMPDVKRPKAANSVPTSNARRQMTNVTPLSLQPLEQAPPLLLTLGAFLAASAIVLAGGRRPATNSENLGEGDELTKMAEKHGLLGVVKATGSDPAAGITLIPTLLAVVLGRRALYERLRAEPGCTEDPQEVFQFFAATLHVLLAMGFPLHRCALPLAAWVGSVELVQVLSRRCKDFAGNNVGGGPLQMLISWAARGIYCNPCTSAQVEVLKWLMHRKANPSQRDSTGRSVLDWTCWAGCDEFASVLLRRSRRPMDVQMPLLLATASRSLRLVKILLDVSGDPHSGPSSDAVSASCGALMLAVRCSEFELATQILQSAAFVNVDVALADGRRSSMPRFAGDEDKGAGAATRATILLVESFRRFASGLQRLSVEEVSVAGLRQHVPGAHPDENLYATSIMPLGDVLHPLAAQLTSPMHWVPLDLRPGCTPMQWIRRGLNPWTPARLMVECLLQRGFKPDEAFLSKVNLALPPEVQSLTRRLAGETGGPAPWPLPTLLAEIIPKDTRRKIPKLTLKEMYHMQGMVPVNGQSKLTSGTNGQDYLEEKSVNEERESPIPKTTEYLKVSRAEVGRPAIRVVVLGAPRVGKSSVTKILAEYLDMTYAVEDEGPTRLRVVRGSWPTARPPVVEVLLWDTVTPTLPELVTEKNCAVVAVAVVDAEDEQREAESMAVLCLSNESFTAPRRALVVENSRSSDDFPRPSGDAELERVRCNILEEEGRMMVKKVFGRLIAEMVGQIEARQEVTATEVISPDTPCGEGDFRQVLTRHRNLPGLGLRKPLGCRSHAYRLRGNSTWVDPTALSLAWRALRAARSTLQAEVQGLTGSSPPGPSGLVSNEAVNATLALAEAGSTGQQLSATLRRALMELNLMCPITSEGKGGAMVLIPDFAEKIALSPSVLQQLTDTTITNGTSRVVFVRLQFSRRCGRVPSLRRALGHFLASKSVPTLRYFAQLEELGHFGKREASPVRDLSDLSGFVLALEGDEKTSTFSELAGIGELVAASQLDMTLLVVMVHGDHWDVLCRGPRATWAWRLFMSHLPSFARLTTTDVADATLPSHTLHGTGELPQQSVTTTTEDLSNIAWLFTGPQSRSLRERLVLNTRRSGCFGSFCSSKFSRFDLEDPAEEFEVRLLLRSWREIPHLLTRVLQRGHHSTWLCTTALHRFAQNFDTLSDADALPMLRLQDQEVQSFDPRDGTTDHTETDGGTTGWTLEASEVTTAVQSWVLLCSPLALWCRHLSVSTQKPEKLEDLARQVAKALQRAAGSAPFSEQLNLELRETLRQKASNADPEVTEI